MKTCKRVRIIALAFIMALTCFGALGVVFDKDASALIKDYEGKSNTVYYFSDCDRTLSDSILKNTVGPMDIQYDTHYWISPQEFSYLVYTGYFWGFEQSEYEKTVVIIEIRSMMPDFYTLKDLFICLQEQGCSIIFVSPYVDTTPEGSDSDMSNYIGYVSGYEDIISPVKLFCAPVSDESVFLEQSVIDMAMMSSGGDNSSWENSDWCNVWKDINILLDDQLIENKRNMTLKDLLVDPFFRRLLLDMRYGGFTQERAAFEDSIYETMWQRHWEQSTGVPYQYSDTKIYSLIEIWKSFYFGDMYWSIMEGEYASFASVVYAAFSVVEEYSPEYYEYWLKKNSDIEENSILNNFVCHNVHIFLSIDNYFWDVLYGDFDIGNYTGISYNELYADPLMHEKLFAMGKWRLKNELYALLKFIQDFRNIETGIVLPIYIWEHEPITWGDGLIIIVDDDLREQYGLSNPSEEEKQMSLDDLLKMLSTLI